MNSSTIYWRTDLPAATAAEIFSYHEQADQLVSADVRISTGQTLEADG